MTGKFHTMKRTGLANNCWRRHFSGVTCRIWWLHVMLMLSAFTGSAVHAQNPGFPVNTFLRINRPAGLPLFQQDNFKIDVKRLDQSCSGFLYGNGQTLKKLADYLIDDPEGRQLWQKKTENAANVLNNWDFKRSGLDLGFIGCFGTDRYIYCVTQLEDLSYIYLLTGQPELGRFIREHLLQIARLPVDFWCHAELRKYSSELPLGMIETADICLSVTVALSATSELYSPAEKEMIETALRIKGLQTCINWLERPRMNNFAAIIGSGAYVAAKYLHNPAAMEKASEVLTLFMNGSIEDDGSYGEGFSYFDYPVRSMLPAILAMNARERESVFSRSGMARSAKWLVYPYLFSKDSNDKMQGTILHFGDNGYTVPEKQSVNYILAKLYNDPLASWLIQKFDGKPGFSEKLLEMAIPGGLPGPESPEQAGLPLLMSFKSGHCYVRSSWNDQGIVMSLWSGDGSRVKYSHQRPELNSICMGAYGEYLVVSPASASYRSALRSLYDQATRSANTITIDDLNQLFRPAEVVACKAGNLADLIVSEAAQAYHVPMESVRRSVLFVRDPGYFVIVDHIRTVESQHKYTWRLHLNNKDDLGQIKNINRNHWHFSRPLASLDIHLFADRELEPKIGQGYLHGPGRDYSPGGIYEGKLGSSIELEAHNLQNTRSMIYYAVIYPTRNGSSAPEVEFTGGKIIVGKDVLTFAGGNCVIKSKGRTEKYILWE